MKSSISRTRKPARRKPQAEPETQPAPAPKPEAKPETREPEPWTQDTPTVSYRLYMEPYDDNHPEFMLLSREEYLDLKIRVCELRGIEPGQRLVLERSCWRSEREAAGFKTTAPLMPLIV